MGIFDYPHRRYNPLTGAWLLVSPHRTQRPWLGQTERMAPEVLPPYDPTCYLCPGNMRSNGERNPNYTSTFVFDNDFPALLPPRSGITDSNSLSGLFRTQPVPGRCQVTCFSPFHNLSIPELSSEQMTSVVHTWIEQTQNLGSLDYIAYVQIFENKGAMMGASNPHPHSQVWASGQIPDEPFKELIHQAEYFRKNHDCLLCNYLNAELKSKERLVTQNEHFTAVVPFWAVWPFEILVITNRHTDSMPDLSKSEQSSLADILQKVTARYDNLFETSFPYSFGFHQAPLKGESYPGIHLHAHYYPPLLRSATVRKFMVGYELMAEPQRDITAESAAERLRSLSEVHFRIKSD